MRELLDTSIKSTDDIAEATDAAVMAGITFDAATTKTPLVSSLGSHEPRVEAFRVLRTNLQFVDVDNANKAFVVTSSVPAEGKSTTAVNTAITLAQTGQKVLLVDGDLRRPQAAKLLGLDDAVGLTTVLVGRVSVDDALQRHETGMDVLTSGVIPPNPAELLQSHAMADLLTELRGRYDVIVIDAPPLLPVTDAALIAAQTDGALLVVRHGRTTKDQLHGAVERLAGVNAHALGVVFNMTPRKSGRGGYGYGYGYGYAPQPADGDEQAGTRSRRRGPGLARSAADRRGSQSNPRRLRASSGVAGVRWASAPSSTARSTSCRLLSTGTPRLSVTTSSMPTRRWPPFDSAARATGSVDLPMPVADQLVTASGSAATPATRASAVPGIPPGTPITKSQWTLPPYGRPNLSSSRCRAWTCPRSNSSNSGTTLRSWLSW